VTNTTPNAGNTNGNPGKIVSMPVTIGKGGSNVDVKNIDVKTTNVQIQNQPIHVNNGNTGIVKLNNNPVNKIQVQNNRPQFNSVGNGGGNNFRQSMNQAPMMGGGGMGGGGNHHGGFMH
jgi:hypothetical protein